MKIKWQILVLAAVLAVLAITPTFAQTTTVKGRVIGPDGNPVQGATVSFVNNENGRKMDLKTDKKGEFFSIGVSSGTYNVTVTKDGQVLDEAKKFQVMLSPPGGENVLDFNLKKKQVEAEAQLTPEQKAQREAALKEHQKISGLNAMLAQAKTAADGGNPQEAVQVMQQATQADPMRDLLWAKLGDYDLMAAKKTPPTERAQATKYYEDAIVAYTKAIEIKPTVGAYYNNLGEAYAKTGKTQEAIKQYQLAAQNDPTDAARYYFNLGAVLTNTGKVNEANDAFDKAIAANPQYAEAYYQKAVNLMGKATVDKEGKMVVPPEVTTNLNKYLELSPTGPNSEAAKQLLASLGSKVETSFGKERKKK